MNAIDPGRLALVRPFRAEDAPEICALFTRAFRRGTAVRADALVAAIKETYLTAPAYRPERGSLVHVDDRGGINGFMGIINIGLRLGERVLQAGVMSAYMAGDQGAGPAVGLTLVRAARRLPLDVLFSDTANRTSLEMSRPLRFQLLPLQSLEWIKVLRPLATATYLLSKRRKRLRELLALPAAAFDRVLSRPRAFQVDEQRLRGVVSTPVTMERFVAAAPAFLDRSSLGPSWDEAELTWLVSHAARQSKSGELRMREVVDRWGRVLGMYLVYAKRGGVAVTLQAVALPGREDLVMRDLLAQARNWGAVAVKGAGSPTVLEGLLLQDGVIYRNLMSCVAWTADPEVAAALRGGRVHLGGLAGETWARIFADGFE